MKIIKRGEENTKSTLYGNDTKAHTLLGADVYGIKTTIAFEKRNLVSAELIRMNFPHPVDVIELNYLKNGIKEKEYKELETVRNDEELEKDGKIFETLEKILSKRDVKSVNASTFAKEIVERLSGESRYAYKCFVGKSTKSANHVIYIYTALALIAASISATNNIDFQAPMKFSSSSKGRELRLLLKINTKSLDGVRKSSIVKIPRLEARLAYISMLCSAEDIKCTATANGDEVAFEYLIKESPQEAPCLHSKQDEENQIFSELLYAFNPPSQYDEDEDFEE
jgi:hypothetical protein